MPMKFETFGAFARHLERIREEIPRAVHEGVKAGIQIAHTEAQAEIGHYQSAIGPFQAWKELADDTKAQRARHGYTENDPELASGRLKEAVAWAAEGHTAAIGVASATVGDGSPGDRVRDIGIVAKAQEFGEHGLPPRSFLGGALCRTADEVVKKSIEPLKHLLEGRPF